jgi:hypothetical protein
MANRMTVAEIFAAVAAALRAAFTPSVFAVWDNPPDATAVPAVWPEYSSSFTPSDRNAGGVIVFRLVAAIAPQTATAETAVICDAHDRFDTINAAAVDAAIAGRTATLEAVQIGGVDHTALAYQLTVARGLPC